MKRLMFAAAAAALALPGMARAATYEIDGAHSTVGFKVRHLMVSWVQGKFTQFKGTFDFDPAKPTETKIDATIDAASIDTGIGDRDKHLRSAEFFDVEQFKTLTFVSKSAKVASKATKNSPVKLKVTGDLTLHGVTKEVVLDLEGPSEPVKDPWGNTKVGATATTKINRKDFGLTWSKAVETGALVVGNDVVITLEIEGNQKVAAAEQK